MKEESEGYRVVPFPAIRQVYVDTLEIGQRKHTVYGLLEADVTRARQTIAGHKARTGETLSFTAYVIACLAKAVEANPYLHAYRDWRGRFVLFDDVDVSTMFEVEIEGHHTPLAHVIRAANRRTFRQIHDEIRSVQARQGGTSRNLYERFMWLYRLVPGFIRRGVWRLLLKSPHRIKKTIGTVQLTAVGMFGQGGGWAITRPLYTLCLAVGGISSRPGLAEGAIEPREYLSLTLAFDHDVVDGGPATRFAQRLKDLLAEYEAAARGLPERSPG